eukprot:Sspe_Gene.8147::Locus_2779_Transcript_2_3_Confidence_0.500_Length_3240::g.8147::m.8147/K00163/aceE; pyruvate dehydrogenase E1 component
MLSCRGIQCLPRVGARLQSSSSRKAPPPCFGRLQEIFNTASKTAQKNLTSVANEWFGTADANKSHSLEYDEFSQMLRKMGMQASEEELDELFGYFDTDEDNMVGYDEFMRSLRGDLPQFSSSLGIGGRYRNVLPSAMRTLPRNISKFDSEETQEWLESLEAVVERHGVSRARFLLHELLSEAQSIGIPIRQPVVTPFVNTIPSSADADFPGDLDMEKRIANMVRWNAVVMVVDTNSRVPGVGGHIGTFASVCDLYEILQNHFLRGKSIGGGMGDSLYVQGHASPGVYARAFMEGRLSFDQVCNFRQEVEPGKGVSSYPHPRLMPDFWENPTVSMGIGPLQSVQQAKFFRYLHLRNLADTSRSRIWTFVGDGEMDESETISAIALAGRERLNNVIWIVNCNYQRLDGPVRGNSKVIQEFEGIFRGAGWDCIKLIWGGKWNDLVESDPEGRLVDRLENHPDGDCQRLAAEGSAANIREELFPGEMAKMVEHFTDEELYEAFMNPGGHDPRKIYSALKQAELNARDGGRPTVILAKTLKGHTIKTFVGRNPVHQMKTMSIADLKKLRDALDVPVSDEDIEKGKYYCRPDKEIVDYMHAQRERLGGFLPQRHVTPISSIVKIPNSSLYTEFDEGTEGKFRKVKKGDKVHEEPIVRTTTFSFVQVLSKLLAVPNFGQRVVPIVSDESRTFGLEGMFKKIGIHAPFGQSYTPVDSKSMMSYHEAPDGQFMQEGISEAGALCTWIASGTSYSSQGCPTLPFFIYYSMFGFQRVGDFIWQAADARTRGFLLGATAGRTTLNGEGLQHQDGHSLLIALTNPGVRAWDPAFEYEVAHIIEHGIEEMWGKDRDVIYYMTLYNESFIMPKKPDWVTKDDIARGMYKFRNPKEGFKHTVRLLGSGCIMAQVLKAADMLEEYGVASEIWSVPSYTELHNEANAVDRHNRLNPTEPKKSFVEECLGSTDVAKVTIACSDHQKAVPELIARHVGGVYDVLGTDGFGRSDTRAALRRFFEIDAESVVVAALSNLYKIGEIEVDAVNNAIKKYNLSQGPRVDITAITA